MIRVIKKAEKIAMSCKIWYNINNGHTAKQF